MQLTTKSIATVIAKLGDIVLEAFGAERKTEDRDLSRHPREMSDPLIARKTAQVPTPTRILWSMDAVIRNGMGPLKHTFTQKRSDLICRPTPVRQYMN